ncbi:MAG: UDP-N-acetylmuramoyl-L-alanyl-D-glutamate--2,6-diaminopimelate ligase [Bacteroides sp.]|nr:UDP-N-acetylmuramoyl-L-alanyl-D-glutamate--2,6-diaminopimelate ligase [Bacteroides sp.]MBD5321024.1 UDP-N-acetylmuramoyl-L-alanyl-D-glutamate--2,6-diaminopimelate ligase [Bacteroides sp.]MBD5349477.1 UDP-N-acetylmuramoyl-L-alanyl-D-glutamate--2,6-diaminopimelate ligase [Bacteroides sp.]
MKSLSDLLSAIAVEEIIGSEAKEITSIESDSRKIKLGSMFVAVRGYNVDGHKFIPLVTLAGASAIVCEELPERLESTVTYIRVANTAVALGYLASHWWGNPSRKLKLVGVTGTNGKTTTATLIYEMARLMGHKAGLLSTVANYIEDERIPATQTTPGALELNELLHRMVVAGCTYAAMEVSSHAAHQHRIAGLKFAGAVFSNLTRDHLDYHQTVDAYISAKKMFFDQLSADSFALINIDDRHGEVMVQNTLAKKYTYSLRQHADFMTRIVETRLDGMLLDINCREVEVLFTGRFNAYNLTAVYGASILLGWDIDSVLLNMSRLVPVAGRFQTIHGPEGVSAIVDYAHTPDALVNVLDTLRDVVGKRGRIITVVGAGGNRDKGKRPEMAQEAARRSDKVVLTSDNPRFENPVDIIHDMEAGLDDEMRTRTLSITDRREAIRTAIMLAGPGDVVLVAGKGHEDYQEIEGVKHHFDDREVILEIFNPKK